MTNSQEENESKRFEQQILEAENRITKAISELFDLDDILRDVCHQVRSELGFDFVGISLVLLAQNTIEAVYGTGIAEDWANRARHYLNAEPNLRDIQADIVKTGRSEIISGWDERFDRWLYDTFGHDQINRIFTPILLARDENGHLINDWFEHYDWQNKYIALEIDSEGKHTVINMEPPSGCASLKVIGTIEAGYENCETPISHEKAIALARLSAQQALNIRRTRLRYVLEVIADNARQILQADLITLHFLLDSHQNHYIYQVHSGSIKNLAPEAFPPRMTEQGLGWQAIQDKEPKFVSSNVESRNLSAYQEGSRSYAAFPLLINRNKQQVIYQTTAANIAAEEDIDQERFESVVGVLYVHYEQDHEFTEEEIYRGESLADRAVDAIWHAMTYQQMREKTRQLTALHSVTQSINQVPEKGDLLSHITWNILNVLAADVVTIYPYLQTEKQFITPPSIAGKLKAVQEMGNEVHEEKVPFQLIRYAQNIYATDIEGWSIFKHSTFARREDIKSVAGILLKVDEDTVGVMFINYRRPHKFLKEEKEIIGTLVSSAAIAIKNQRWLQTLNDIDREIITTLQPEKLLDLIVRRAVQITGAELGVVRRQESISQNLIAQVIYPASEPVNEHWKIIRAGEGITGKVALSRKPELIEDVKNNQSYLPYFANTCSEICVPLLEKDGEDGGIIGVLNVESRNKIFTQRDLQRLEVLADLAVIAIQNAETKEKLSKMEMMATLGELASQLLHRMNNDVGASKVLLREVVSSLNQKDMEGAKGRASQTLQLVNRISQNLGGLKTWRQEQPQRVNLEQAVFQALDQIQPQRSCTLEVSISPDLPVVYCGEQQLIGIFDNLIQNAIDAMPNEGVLSIAGICIQRDADLWVKVCVTDTGLGIIKENLERIFELGFTTKSAQGSMGFGLWWTSRQVESLGGQLLVNSFVGRGTQVTLILPAVS